MKINPLLLLDYYKTTHSSQYPAGLTRLVSYLTPRMSRIPGQDKLVLFGLQAFIKQYLMEDMWECFFRRPKRAVLDEYKYIMDNTLGVGAYDLEKIAYLHDLGYLPLQISALPEGSCVDMHVPMIEITNTHPDFVWLVNTIETLLSCTLWHTMVSANVGRMYRQIVNEYYDKTVDDDVPRAKALGDFSMRGQESCESAMKSSAAFCLSFLNTATVPSVIWLENYYDADCGKEPVAFGAISTEHSVMCSNYAVDGDEITMVRRLLTEIYPHHSFSMVSDSYDYWNMVDHILPQLKDEILAHDGCLLVRGDSGDPVDIVTKTVFHLWDTFGGTVNSKGYKVLNPHVKALYGDSITPQRCEAIYKILMEAGFACNNVVLGVGSFSMQCLEKFSVSGIDYPQRMQVSYSPYTRDTFGIAVKSTYAEDKDGNPIMIYKDPKTDSAHFKKSQRGCCTVSYDRDKDCFSYRDGLTWKDASDAKSSSNMLKTVFKDGELVRVQSLDQVRSVLWNGEF